MANTIQIKRSTQGNAPGTLAQGELAWIDDGGTGTLYIGDATGGAVKEIGGSAAGDWGTNFRTNLALIDDATMDNMTMNAGTAEAKHVLDATAAHCEIRATTQSPSNGSTLVATTAYVDSQISTTGGSLPNMQDVTITNPQAADLLIHDGAGQWKNQSLGGAGSDVTVNTTGDMLVNSVQANSVNLGTDTVGQYAKSIVHGSDNNIVVSDDGAEGAAYTVELADHITINGDLTVNGTTTTVESTQVSINDPVFIMGEAGSVDDGKDRGIEFNYFDGTAKKGFFGWDNSAEAFTFMHSATNASGNEVFAGTTGDVLFNNITGTLTAGAQDNITSATDLVAVGTITTGTWNAGVVGETYGGTGQSTYTKGQILISDSADQLTVLNIGAAGTMLKVSSSGLPEWSDSIDGGTFP